MIQNKPIGFILYKRAESRWYKLPINTFEPYTTGEFLNYPENWMPVYLKPEFINATPIGYINSIKKSNLMFFASEILEHKIINILIPVYKHLNVQNFRYALMVEGRSAPTKLHDSLEDAEKEAIRLAEKEKCKVYVLKAISEFSITQEVKKIHLL